MEITQSNFNEQISNITNDLKNAAFVGFDAEFTAILSGESFKHRLFDTTEERYNKIKNEVSKMIMTQVGLTMFHYERDSDQYVATGYTFHLCPQDFSDVDQSFIFQASTLKFLCKHNFNFNKFTYEGLPYLNKVEETVIREHLKNKTMVQSIIHGFTMEEERELQHYCSAVSQWLTSKTNLFEDQMYLDIDDPVMRYVVHNELRSRFLTILTTHSLGNSNKILIYRDKTVEGANNSPIELLEENLMDHVLGFSRIIALLEQYQKPIVGHNIFLDIVLLHNQFIGPLPSDYRKFKRNIHAMFPRVYDTKFISHQMNKILSYDEVWKSNALQDLYEFFKEGKCKKLQVGVNMITLSSPFNAKQSYHEAGWDSYCSGYCFIRLGHWAAAACVNSGSKRTVGPSELLAGLAPYINQVNVIRAATLYMDLAEEDPPRQRPDWLHILALQEPVINVGKIATILSIYGSIDVKPHGTKTALIAANSKITSDRILKGFKADKEYRISPYNPSRYSASSRIAIWGGALITGSLVLYLVNRKMKSIS